MTARTKHRPPAFAGRAAGKPATVGCAAVGCQHTVTRPLLMCMDHWRLVPKALQRQVWACWRRLGHDADAPQAHTKAVLAAVEAVHGKQMARRAKRDASTPDLF